MTTPNRSAPEPANYLSLDSTLVPLRHAYHTLEAFQLSDEHREVKESLRQRLSEPATRIPITTHSDKPLR